MPPSDQYSVVALVEPMTAIHTKEFNNEHEQKPRT